MLSIISRAIRAFVDMPKRAEEQHRSDFRDEKSTSDNISMFKFTRNKNGTFKDPELEEEYREWLRRKMAI